MAEMVRIGLDPRLRKAAQKDRNQQKILEYIERKVPFVKQHPWKYLQGYQSRSDIWEWEIYSGNRVFLEDIHSRDGTRTLIIVDFGKHDLHRKYRRSKVPMALCPSEYELLTT